MLEPMDNLGDQVAYLVLHEGTPVYSSDEQEVGTVSQVLAAGNDDIFDGLMMTGRFRKHYVRADSIDAIYERGVVLSIDAAACKDLPHEGPGRA
jgi:hypothetical protein